jgi:hypothetical protein
MTRILRSCFLLLALSAVLGSAHGEESTQIELPTREPTVLKFKAFDPNRVLIDEQVVLKEFLKSLGKQTKWPLTVKNGTVGHMAGLRTSIDAPQSRIRFEYVNLDLYDSGSQYGQTLAIPVSYEMVRTDQDFSIRLTTPRTADFVTRSSHGIFRVPTPKLNPPEEMLQDFSSLLDVAPRLAVDEQCAVKREKTSKYKPDAVLGNFERLLGRYGNGSGDVQANGLDRTDVFAYLVGQLRVPLRITAVPYRDGTKIIYETSLPFTLRPDGTGEGYDRPDKLNADIDRILTD